MSAPAGHRALRTATVMAALVHLTAVALHLADALLASGVVVDPLRPVPLAAVYAAPAVLAIAGLRARTPLLLAAAVSAGVLAIFPFSLHSFLLVPAAIVYGIAAARLSGAGAPRRALLAILGCPLVLVAALLVLTIWDHPACYEELETGEIIIERDPGAATAGSQLIEADSGVVAAGCASDTVVWWEAAASMALSIAGVATLAARGVRRPAGDTRLVSASAGIIH